MFILKRRNFFGFVSFLEYILLVLYKYIHTHMGEDLCKYLCHSTLSLFVKQLIQIKMTTAIMFIIKNI